MVNIDKIIIDSRFGSGFLVVRWSIGSIYEAAEDYRFNVYRSGSPSSGYELIASEVEGLEYQDNAANLQNSSIKYYYKVEVVDASGETSMSAMYGELQSLDSDPIADTIIFSNGKLLELLTKGKDNAYILLRKRTGQKCPVCWDPVRKSVSKSLCTVCYNVGITGGYYDPISTKISLGQPGKGVDFAETGFKEMIAPISAWTSNYPLLQPDDIIVDNFNRRYTVKSWRPTIKDQTTIIRQTLELQEIPHTNIIYQFPIQTADSTQGADSNE